MYRHFNSQLGHEVVIIHPGEFFATKEQVIISTVLGSCVAVALFDTKKQFGGLNHFMLPGNESNKDFYATSSGKYGMYAMELLINELIKQGSRREDIIAKVFGGASVLQKQNNFGNRISENNIEFAFSYLKVEKIPVISSNVGGVEARKIFFYPWTSKILHKKISGTILKPIELEEQSYLEKLTQKLTKTGNNVTTF